MQPAHFFGHQLRYCIVCFKKRFPGASPVPHEARSLEPCVSCENAVEVYYTLREKIKTEVLHGIKG